MAAILSWPQCVNPHQWLSTRLCYVMEIHTKPSVSISYYFSTFLSWLHCVYRSDPQVILSIEKCIMRGKPVLLENCTNNIDTMVMPLIQHCNAADPRDEEGEFMCWIGLNNIIILFVYINLQFILFLGINTLRPRQNGWLFQMPFFEWKCIDFK